MSENAPEVVSPEILEGQFQEDTELKTKIQKVTEAIALAADLIGSTEGTPDVRNVAQSLIGQEEIYSRLYTLYEEVFTIWQRLRGLMSKSTFSDEEKKSIRDRASQIISESIFQLQREVFFKIVNAKEVDEGETNEDGPALLFPAIEKVKNSIIRNIQSQAQQLRPVAVDICKTFQGIADAYVETENFKPGEKPSYETISQAYELEKRIREEITRDISLVKIDEISYLDSIIESFKKLNLTYRLKMKALNDKHQEETVDNFEDKVKVLQGGFDKANQRVKPLMVLKNLVQRFPALEKQLDFFAESQYQAKAVMKFLEEVSEEMGQVFSNYTLESFTVVSFLRYKLNGTSHMYESIYYYYAVVQIEADIRKALEKRYANEPETKDESIAGELNETEIEKIIRRMHELIAVMNNATYRIHLAFLEYKSKKDLERLRRILQKQTEVINKCHQKVKLIYKKAQNVFFAFLTADLGATDIAHQFNAFMKIQKDLPEAVDIRKSFTKLLATKRGDLEILVKELTEQFGGKLPEGKIGAMATLKIRQDFQNELLSEVQEHSRAQYVFLHILKEFIKIQDEQDSSHKNDSAVVALVQKDFSTELAQFKTHEVKLYQKILQNPNLSERDLAVCFLASNITPQEIESFSRLLPALPRNEFQLDSPYGRILLDVKSMHKERLQSRGASLAHMTEKIYEKREHIKLVNNICLFFKSCAEPFYRKVDIEELKINQMIMLQKRKYSKELNEITKYWQYLVQEQINPGQGERGRFRDYSPEEKQLMMKYISPDQLHTLERQLESSYDLTGEKSLFEVESFLMEIVSGLFENFKKDYRIKSAFETFEKGKKIKQRQFQDDDYKDILNSDSFVPNVRKCMTRVKRITRQNAIASFLDYWEYLIDKDVPVSEKRKKKEAAKVTINKDSDDAVFNISPEQLDQIRQDLDLIQTVRDAEKQNKLFQEGRPLLEIVKQCFGVFKTGQKKLVLEEVDDLRKERMQHYCDDADFEKVVNTALN